MLFLVREYEHVTVAEAIFPFVILSAAKNLVLHQDVSTFSRYSVAVGKVVFGLWRTRFLTPFEMTSTDFGWCKKGGIWVVRDEILHCVQNDKGGAWRLRSHNVRPPTDSSLRSE